MISVADRPCWWYSFAISMVCSLIASGEARWGSAMCHHTPVVVGGKSNLWQSLGLNPVWMSMSRASASAFYALAGQTLLKSQQLHAALVQYQA
jgi:hypothetical protein